MTKILVVDDERDVVELVSFNLRKAGYEVEGAFDAVDALHKARCWLPDLIVLDLMLPELDGTAVCGILRCTPTTATIPVIMLTACATDAAKLIALHAGVDAYVTKPFSPHALVDQVKGLVGKKHSLGRFPGDDGQ